MRNLQILARQVQRTIVQPTRTISMRESLTAAREGGVVPGGEGYKKIQAVQNYMVREDGLLVWQKKGMVDQLPYYITMVVAGTGTLYGFKILWDMMWPKCK